MENDNKRTGVKLLLVPGAITRIHLVKKQGGALSLEHVVEKKGWFKSKEVAYDVLIMENVEARFFVGGIVLIYQLGDIRHEWGGFQEKEVLEIRNLDNNLLERNYFMCKKCFKNTGEIINQEDILGTYGRKTMDTVFQCTECEHTWNLII